MNESIKGVASNASDRQASIYHAGPSKSIPRKFFTRRKHFFQKFVYLCIMILVQRHTIEQTFIGHAYEWNCFAWRLRTY
jgi:hypothetical protein